MYVCPSHQPIGAWAGNFQNQTTAEDGPCISSLRKTICFGTFLCARQTVIVYRCNSYQSYPLTHSTSRSGECIKQRTVEGSKYTYRSRSEHLPDFSSVLSVLLQKERGSVGVGCNLSKSRHSAIYMRTTVFPLSSRLIVKRAKSVHSNTFSSFFFL